jgi:hypothetical protein
MFWGTEFFWTMDAMIGETRNRPRHTKAGEAPEADEEENNMINPTAAVNSQVT